MTLRKRWQRRRDATGLRKGTKPEGNPAESFYGAEINLYHPVAVAFACNFFQILDLFICDFFRRKRDARRTCDDLAIQNVEIPNSTLHRRCEIATLRRRPSPLYLIRKTITTKYVAFAVKILKSPSNCQISLQQQFLHI